MRKSQDEAEQPALTTFYKKRKVVEAKPMQKLLTSSFNTNLARKKVSSVECSAGEEKVLEDEIEYASDDVPTPEPKVKSKAKPVCKQKSLADYHELEEDEDTLFIDNLPNTTNQIHALLAKVETHAEALEKSFIMEEDSDEECEKLRKEEEMEEELFNSSMTVK